MSSIELPPQEDPQDPKPSLALQSVIDRNVAEDRARQERSFLGTMQAALEVDPVKASVARSLAKELGVSEAAALSDPTVLKRYAVMQHLERSKLSETNPVLASHLSQLDFARVAHDQADKLGAWEGFFQSFEAGAREAQLGKMQWQGMFRRLSEDEAAQVTWLQRRLKQLPPSDGGFFWGMGRMAGQSAQILPEALAWGAATASVAAAASAATGPAALGVAPVSASTAFGLGALMSAIDQSRQIEGGLAFDEYIAKNYDPVVAARAARIVGNVNGVLEGLGDVALAGFGGKALGLLKSRIRKEVADVLMRPDRWAELGKAAARTVGSTTGEIGVELGQEATTMLLEKWAHDLTTNPEKMASAIDSGSFGEALVDIARITAESSVLIAAVAPFIRYRGAVRDIKAGEAQAKFLQQLVGASKGDEVRGRAPDLHSQYLQRVSEAGNRDTLYLNAEATAKALNAAIDAAGTAGTPNPAEQLNEKFPGLLSKLEEARKSPDGFVAVPAGRWLSEVLETPMGQALVEHMTFDPDTPTITETRDAQANADGMKRAAEADAEKHLAKHTEWNTQADAVEAEIMTRYKSISPPGVPPELMSAHARFLRNIVVNQAAEDKMDPRSWWARHGFQLTGDKDPQASVDTNQQAGVRAGSYQLPAAANDATYGTKPGAEVVGVHFSREPRTALSGEMYGTGASGAESRRVTGDPVLSKRVHFYVDTGQGVVPEPGVGFHAHVTKLTNVYNTNEDPAGIVAAWRERRANGEPVNPNDLETAIVNAGYDGYYVPAAQGEQGVAVLIGPQHTNVPTTYRPGVRPMLAQFGGVKARSANNLLTTAQSRIAAGEDPETVRRTTGWSRGPDNSWRFEISDHDAKWRAQPGAPKRMGPLATAAGATPVWGTGAVKIELKYLLDHPRLFEAYPQFGELPVEVRALPQGYKGGYNPGATPGTGTITLAAQATPEEALSTVLHELQHVIQDFEGHAQGGYVGKTREAPAAHAELVREAEKRLISRVLQQAEKHVALAAEGNPAIRGMILDPAVPMPTRGEIAAALATTRFAPLNVFGQATDAFEDFAKAARGQMSEQMKDNADADAAYEGYRRLFGEIEARNTQARQALTPEQRAATPIESTQDIKDGPVFVVLNDKIVNLPPANTQAAPDVLYQVDAGEEAAKRGFALVAETTRLDNAMDLAASKQWGTQRDLMVELQKNTRETAAAAGVSLVQRKASGVEEVDPSTPTEDYLVQAAVTDAKMALRTNSNAVGWYDLRTRQALAVMAEAFPELRTDTTARFAFTYVLAVTSNGLKVDKNFELAAKAYRSYRKNKRMPTNVGIGKARAAINQSLALFNNLSDRWGVDRLRLLMQTPIRVGDLEKATGQIIAGEDKATEVYGAAILGPKIGNGFFMNLNGVFDQLTMDRWLLRTWGRWSGTLLLDRPDLVAKSSERLRAAVAALTPEEKAGVEAMSSVRFAEGDAAVAAAVTKLTEDADARAQLALLGDKVDELRRAANLFTSTVDGQKMAPTDGAERTYIRRVFARALAELREQVPGAAGLSMADLQAVLWYAERRLYDTARGQETVEGYDDNEAPDYANAAAATARQLKVNPDKIAAALRREEENGLAGTARLPDPAATLGFDPRERKLFLGGVATLLARDGRRTRRAREAASWAVTRESVGPGRYSGVLTARGARVVATYDAGLKLANRYRAADLTTPTIVELDGNDRASADVFREALVRFRGAAGPNGAAVSVLPDYKGSRLFLSESGRTGVAVTSTGEVVSLFSEEGAGRMAVEVAVASGGTHLNTFDTVTPALYSAHGFVAVARAPWNESMRPEGWSKDHFRDFNSGEPDVVYMVYDPTSRELYQPGRGDVAARPPLTGLPPTVEVDGKQVAFAPNEAARSAALKYMRRAGLPYHPPTVYAEVDVERARRIAKAYEEMKHAPDDPEVRAAYEALARETVAQYEAMLEAGVVVEFNPGTDPYGNPRNAVLDVNRNNHLYVFSTEAGYGQAGISEKDRQENPMLRDSGFKISGRTALVNDLFRAVHDYYGHAKEAVGFRARGEENAWQQHMAMYSPLARRAATTETRGQNSWLNYGPHSEKNQTAKTEDTVFAEQKIGLLPEWVVNEGYLGETAPEVVEDATARAEALQAAALRKLAEKPRVLRQDDTGLIATHSLSREALFKVAKTGGLPAPSLGVISTRAGEVHGFGDIVLLGDRVAAPETGTPVWDRDAYTPRVPSVVKTLNVKRIAGELLPTLEGVVARLPQEAQSSRQQRITRSLESNPKKTFADPMDVFVNDPALRVYLVEQMIGAQVPIPGHGAASRLRAPVFQNTTGRYLGRLGDFITAEQWDRATSEARVGGLTQALLRMFPERAFTAPGQPSVYELVNTMNRYNPELIHGEVAVSRAVVDELAVREGTNDRTHQLNVSLDAMARNILKGYFEEVIEENGKPATLDNLVEAMLAVDDLRSAEGVVGVGATVAASARQFDNTEALRRAAAALGTEAKFKEEAREFRSRLSELSNALAPIAGSVLDTDLIEAMYSLDARRATTPGAIRRAAEEVAVELSDDGSDTPVDPGAMTELVDALASAYEVWATMQVPYFEAKPKRGVKLSEFKRAVLPDSYRGDQKVLDILKENGLAVDFVDSQMKETARWDVIRDIAAKNDVRFQDEKVVRGGYYRDAKDVPFINLNKVHANASTFLHEVMHWYLDTIERIASVNPTSTASQSLDTAVAWFGVTREEWAKMSFSEREKHHEALASAFEAYLHEGKAPTRELSRLFAKIARFIRNVYQDVMLALDARHQRLFGEPLPALTPEIRGMFDRMVASAEEIERAQDEDSMSLRFFTEEQAVALGFSPAEWAAAQREDHDATDDAIAELTAASMRDARWLTNRTSKAEKELTAEERRIRATVMREAAAEVAATPVERARYWLRTGKLRDESGGDMQRDPDENHKLAAAAVEEWLRLVPTPEKQAARLRAAASKEGLEPGVLAEMFGFDDASALMRALAAAPVAGDEIQARTDARMRQEYSDLTDPAERRKAVVRAIHNEARARAVATMLRTTAKLTTPARALVAAARSAAEQLLSIASVRDITVKRFAAEERRAARLVQDAIKSGNLADLQTALKRQMLANQQVVVASEVERQIDRDLRGFEKVWASPLKLARTHELDIVNLARAVLASFGLGKGSRLPREYLAEIQANNPTLGNELDAELRSITGGNTMQSYRDLTLQQFQQLRDKVAELFWRAQRERWMTVEGQRVERNQAVDELTARAQETLQKTPDLSARLQITPEMKRAANLSGALTWLERVEFWARGMDGDREGPFTKYLFRPLRDAFSVYEAERNAMIRDLRNAMRKLDLSARRIATPFRAPNTGKPYVFETKADLLGAMTHMGNRGEATSNLDNLLLGNNWARANADGSADTSVWDAFIEELIRTKVLTAADFEFLETIWALNEQLRPRAQEATHNLTGSYFEAMKPVPFTNSLGTWKGGYVPLVPDPDQPGGAVISQRAGLDALKDSARDVRNTLPQTASGWRIKRVASTKPVVMNLHAQVAHIDSVLRYVHLQPRVTDLASVLRDARFNAFMTAVSPSAITELLIPWATRTVHNRIMESNGARAWVVTLLALRRIAGATTMMWQVVNAAQQVTGLFNSNLYVKGRFLRAGFWDHIARWGSTDDVAQMSPMMRELLSNESEDVRQDLQLLIDPSTWGQVTRFTDRYVYVLQRTVQNQVNLVTWRGAYRQALAAGKTPAAAVSDADAAVRMSQGSAAAPDISRLEASGPFIRMFLQFGGYFNTVLNQIAAANGWDQKALTAVRASIVPGLIGGLIASFLRGDELDDDDGDGGVGDEVTAWALGNVGRSLSGLVPFGTFVVSLATPDAVGRNLTPPAAAMLAKSAQGAWELGKLVFAGDPMSGADVRNLFLFLSLPGVPLTPIGRALGYQKDVADGKVQPASTWDFIRGTITGVAGEKSRGK